MVDDVSATAVTSAGPPVTATSNEYATNASVAQPASANISNEPVANPSVAQSAESSSVSNEPVANLQSSNISNELVANSSAAHTAQYSGASNESMVNPSVAPTKQANIASNGPVTNPPKAQLAQSNNAFNQSMANPPADTNQSDIGPNGPMANPTNAQAAQSNNAPIEPVVNPSKAQAAQSSNGSSSLISGNLPSVNVTPSDENEPEVDSVDLRKPAPNSHQRPEQARGMIAAVNSTAENQVHNSVTPAAGPGNEFNNTQVSFGNIARTTPSVTKLLSDATASPSATVASRLYLLPKLIVTPVEMSSEEPEIAPKPGYTHATSQTMISSAPSLRISEDGATVIEDPTVAESVTVIRRYQRVIRRVFDHYANADTHVLDQSAFFTLCKEFSVLPTLIERDDLEAVFKAVRASVLTFRDLISCLTRLALMVYRNHPRLDAAEQKLSSLFRAMQLDQKDIVLHRLRKSLSTSPASAVIDFNAIDFDQKDLDQEVNRILDSMPNFSDTAAESKVTPYDIIGPLSAQVQTTIDKVKQYTAEPWRPSKPPVVLSRRSSTGLGESDPFLRPIVPPGPVTTLPPLYYPGVTSSSFRRPVAEEPTPLPSTWRSSQEAETVLSIPKQKNDDDRKIVKRRGVGTAAGPAAPTAPLEKAKSKTRVGEEAREKAAKVTAAEKTSEQAMQRKHMGQIDRRRGHQLQRLGRQIPTQFAGRYAVTSAATS